MSFLLIRHIPDANIARFQVIRGRDGKSTDPVPVPVPTYKRIDGTQSTLLEEMRWYLEVFLDYPFHPNIGRAEEFLRSIKKWGEDAFVALFGTRQGGRFFDQMTKDGHDKLELVVCADDPAILAWPWEAMEDPEAGPIGQTCKISRRLNCLRDPQKISVCLPSDSINILMVTARPYEHDVAYCAVSKPLLDLIRQKALPVHMHVLRPPTFDQLKRHLCERPHHYHIIHFDGHGAYGNSDSIAIDRTASFSTPKGSLVFESEEGEPDPKTGEQLASLLREHQIPAVVLNACRSGMVDDKASDPFASVATSLLRCGVRSIVAMSYSLYVSGAEQFLPSFYLRLFESGSILEATRAGRQQMLAHPERACAIGTYPLYDWFVPVVYEQDPYSFVFQKASIGDTAGEQHTLPEEITRFQSQYGFIGRDSTFLELERGMRRISPVILLHGLSGIGKSTLLAAWLKWLHDTEGLPGASFWFDFSTVRTAEFVLNRIGETRFGAAFNLIPMVNKVEKLVETLRSEPFLIIWDNFEVVGPDLTDPKAGTMSADDREWLLRFVNGLHGGLSKIICATRSSINWLQQESYPIQLSGLRGEECWLYCNTILGEKNVVVDRSAQEFLQLVRHLHGHPLAMQIVLPLLRGSSPEQVIGMLTSHYTVAGQHEQEPLETLFAVLQLTENSIPINLRELLVPLSFHYGHVDAELLTDITKQAGKPRSRQKVDALLSQLAAAGVLHISNRANTYEIHPALTSYLKYRLLPKVPSKKALSWLKAFVTVVGKLADWLALQPPHQHRGCFYYYGANLIFALEESKRLHMDLYLRALLRAFGNYAQSSNNYDEASLRYQELLEANRAVGDKVKEAETLLALGDIELLKRNFETTEDYYRQTLEIAKKSCDEVFLAAIYHQLGMLAEERRLYKDAREWYIKSQKIREKNDYKGIASTYHQLGLLAIQERDLTSAEAWFRKSLAAKEKSGDNWGAGNSYFHLGIVKQQRGALLEARDFFHKALIINEEYGDMERVARIYHHIGIVAFKLGDLHESDRMLSKALAIAELKGIEYGIAVVCHQLGMNARTRGDLNTAQKWYNRAIELSEKIQDMHGAAITYGEMGIVAGLEKRFVEMGEWHTKAIRLLLDAEDVVEAVRNMRNFRGFYKEASQSEKIRLQYLWNQAGFHILPWEGAGPL